MLSRTALLAALTLISACSANAHPTVAMAPMEVAPVEVAQAVPDVAMRHETPMRHAAAMLCEVTTARGAGGLRVDAVAHAGAPFDGEYDVRIRSSGPHGDSDVVQNGPVRLASGETATLGTTELGAGRRAETRVTFTVRDADGEACHVERRI